jgi:hypothetical protein
VLKLLVGILKGAVIGAAAGYGAYAAGDFLNAWVLYGLIGAFVGLLVGKPIWSLIRDQNSTSWVAILKAAFGFGIGCGLYAIVAKAWAPAPWIVNNVNVFAWPVTMGGAIGAVYGGFVELDDAIGDAPGGKKGVPANKQIAAKKK